MEDFERVKVLFEACLSNAEHLLGAAKDTRKPGRNHIAYHLAAIALEELGKATMITVSSLPLPTAADDDDDRRPIDSIDDHRKKLFWAFWAPSFGSQRLSPDRFHEYQSLANDIHRIRLQALYVDPSHVEAREEVSDEEVDRIIALAESLLELEKAKELKPLDEAAREMMDWFFRASADPQLKGIVFSKGSLAKLAELNNPKDWVSWLRQQVDEMNQLSEQLMRKELQQGQPAPNEENQPKWRIKIRLHSWSHSIRPKALTWWNERMNGIKLFPTTDKRELAVQFEIPKKISIQMLWPAGMHNAMIFVIALNVGAFGFFWWYVPEFVSKYYDEIVDLENNANVKLETAPRVAPTWGHQAVREAELANVATMFVHLVHASDKQQEMYQRYFRAIGILAKNDIFVHLEPTVMMEFYELFRSALTAYNDWDGSADTLDPAIVAISQEFRMPPEHLEDLKSMLRIGEQLVAKRSDPTPPLPVTIEEVGKMKAHLDIYLFLRARRQVHGSVAGESAGTLERN